MAQASEHAGEPLSPMTVGQVAERFDVTVRTLHHYDEIGLLCPRERSVAGYRLYTDEDLTRLQHVVVYRRLGFALEEIALLLDDPDADLVEHLRRQRAAVMSRLDEMGDLVKAIDRALEVEMSGIKLSKEEQRELFGDSFSDDHAQEAEQRWGDTEAWRQSQRRTSQYTKQDWQQIKVEADAINTAFVEVKRTGEPVTGEAAMEAAEQHRQHIHERFYELPHAMHRGLGDMYVSDQRFTKTYEDLESGLAQFVRDAIHANADRHEATDAAD
ncbi:MAG: MerR family transcriptional regulator [Actinomycetota bacterium]|nr:MerR family transcriptional regulator [Actinomycetota bacterium]